MLTLSRGDKIHSIKDYSLFLFMLLLMLSWRVASSMIGAVFGNMPTSKTRFSRFSSENPACVKAGLCLPQLHISFAEVDDCFADTVSTVRQQYGS